MEYLFGLFVISLIEKSSPSLFDTTLGICVLGC